MVLTNSPQRKTEGEVSLAEAVPYHADSDSDSSDNDSDDESTLVKTPKSVRGPDDDSDSGSGWDEEYVYWLDATNTSLSMKINKRQAPQLPTIFITRDDEMYGALVTIPLVELSISVKELNNKMEDVHGILINYQLESNYTLFNKRSRLLFKSFEPQLTKYKNKFSYFVDVMNAKRFPKEGSGIKVLEIMVWSNHMVAGHAAVNSYLRFIGENPKKIDVHKPYIPEEIKVEPTVYGNISTEEALKYLEEKEKRNPDYARRERPLTIWQQYVLANFRFDNAYCKLDWKERDFDNWKITRRVRHMWRELFSISQRLNINKLKLPVMQDPTKVTEATGGKGSGQSRKPTQSGQIGNRDTIQSITDDIVEAIEDEDRDFFNAGGFGGGGEPPNRGDGNSEDDDGDDEDEQHHEEEGEEAECEEEEEERHQEVPDMEGHCEDANKGNE